MPDSRLLKACAGREVDATPIYLMRQAGRYMPEYREIRARHSMLELMNTPELAARITLQPIESFDLDAAIIFADILPPLIGMGLKLEYVAGKGPVIENPIASTRDVDLLATPPAESTMGPTLEAIRIVTSELDARQTPLIGFGGAPFTIASYAIEGGSSKSFARAKALMYREPAAWDRLMRKIVTVQVDFLLEQVSAGASALQIFDSWAGLALSRDDYVRYVLPYNRRLFTAIESAGVPVINFSTGTFPYLERVAEGGGSVIGVDWRMPLADAWDRLGHDRPVMGNLDPVALLAPWRELRARVDIVLDQAEGRVGHIFNLGHGILPDTPVEHVGLLVDYVHERTSR